MAENGILDYQGMNQAIYRGATSNIVVDTQSMSIEIGAGNSSHTSNLHIECDHAANVASIQLNSNVVTEFSRSKKLIKYPRVAMTANSSGGYVASAHSEYPDGTNYHAFRVFNNRGVNVPYVAGVGWESANTDTFGDDGLWGGSNASGAPTSSSANTTMTLENGNTIYGEWLQIQLPTKIRLEYVNFLILSGSAHAMAHRAPRAGYVLGSNNGTNWTTLKNWSGIVYDTWTAYYDKFYKFDIDKEVDNYQYFRFVWTETASGSGTSLSRYASCQELEFWGVPEYDPEAHGTDVTVKSKTNVPNTDWLEVYYDAKGLEDDATLSAVSGLGGTTINGTTLGDPQVSNKAFVFDGSGDAIVSGATSLSGNPPLSYSVWFKTNSIISGSNSIVMIGYAAGTKSTGFRIQATTGMYRFYVYSGATNESVNTDIKAKIGIWTHATVVYDGLNSKLYIDGQFALQNTNTTTGLALNSGAKVALGNYINSSGTLFDATRSYNGSIANFRLFNRVLTSDEIYQLYAYQKEYFGHGDLSMTLKAGRLGIGTSEPRAALDVRGDVRGGCPVYFQAELTVNNFEAAAYNTATSGAVITWDKLYENTGCYNTTTGLFTAPMTAVYKFGYGMRSADSSKSDYWTYIQKNGAAAKSAGDTPGRIYSPNDYNTNFSSFIMDLRAGDTVGILLASTNTGPQISNSYGYFHGHYFSESRGQHHFWD